LSLVLGRPWRGLLKASTSTAIRQPIFTACGARVSPKQRALAYRSHRRCGSTLSAPIGCPTRTSQIAIEPAAPPHVSPPAISSFGGLRTPALKPLSSPPPPSPAGIRKPSQFRKSAGLFDHLVGDREHARRNAQAEVLG